MKQELSPLEKAKQELAEKKKAIREQEKKETEELRKQIRVLRDQNTIKGAKTQVNKVYNDLYKQDKPQEELTKAFWQGVKALAEKNL